MKIPPSLFLLASLILAPLALASNDRVAPIEAVTVFPDRAVVTRVLSEQIPAGPHTWRVVDLTNQLQPESIQVTVRGAGVTLLDVRVEDVFSAPVPLERLQPLVDKRDELRRSVRDLDRELRILRQQVDYLGKIESATTAPRSEGEIPGPETWEGMLHFFQRSLADLLPAIEEREEIRKKREEELNAVEREIAQTRGGERQRRKAALIRFEAAQAGAATLSLTYGVSGAGWQPLYDIRVQSREKSVALDYRAAIRQRSGEDWSDVILTLSTARPSLGANPPRLDPWFLSEFRPRLPAPAAAPLLRSRGLEMADEAVAFEAKEMVAEAVASLTAVNLRVPVRVSIPADGEPYRVAIDTIPLQGDFFYTAVPKLSEHAYLQARVRHAGRAPILAGQAQLFMDGGLVGSSRLERVEPGEEFDLSLGVDEAIRIERKLVRRFVEQRGLLSKVTRTRFEFVTTITNQRSTSERLVLKDQIPVPQHERIKIDLIQVSRGEPDPELPGGLTWNLPLAPGGKIELPLHFVVEHPEDMPVIGL
jgi:uncharacterized protein (TIGR02231 family)